MKLKASRYAHWSVVLVICIRKLVLRTVSAAALLLLLFLVALALSRLEKQPTLHTDPPPDNIPSPDATDGLTETATGLLDSEIVTEPETEDGHGFYEGTEVYVYQLPYDYEYFADHPVFTDGDLRLGVQGIDQLQNFGLVLIDDVS